jgi:hypothetical protein
MCIETSTVSNLLFSPYVQHLPPRFRSLFGSGWNDRLTVLKHLLRVVFGPQRSETIVLRAPVQVFDQVVRQGRVDWRSEEGSAEGQAARRRGRTVVDVGTVCTIPVFKHGRDESAVHAVRKEERGVERSALARRERGRRCGSWRDSRLHKSDAELWVGVSVSRRTGVQLPDEEGVAATEGIVVEGDRVDG